jgi:hypothetical protein
MIFRLSQKLARKLKVAPANCAGPDPNPFADWSGHLFTADRAQYIILANTASLYSVVMHGCGITDDGQFLDAALGQMREFLVADGREFIFRRLIAPAAKEVRFSKPLSRSVIRLMNDLVYHAGCYLGEDGLSPFEASERLNGIPLKVLGYRFPSEVFTSMQVEQPASETSGGQDRFPPE